MKAYHEPEAYYERVPKVYHADTVSDPTELLRVMRREGLAWVLTRHPLGLWIPEALDTQLKRRSFWPSYQELRLANRARREYVSDGCVLYGRP